MSRGCKNRPPAVKTTSSLQHRKTWVQVFHLENPGEVAPGATASSPTKKLKSTTPFKVKHFETKRGPQGFVSFSHENPFLRTGNNVSGGVPSRRQLPVTEPVPFQVFLNSDRLLQCGMLSKIESVISLTCPQLEGSKRFDQRAAAKQEGVLRWVDKFIFVHEQNKNAN